MNNCPSELPSAEALTTQLLHQGAAEIHLRLLAQTTDDAERVLPLLSCWWLRWVPSISCQFWWDNGYWHARCEPPAPPDPRFQWVLQDLLTIKHAVFKC